MRRAVVFGGLGLFLTAAFGAGFLVTHHSSRRSTQPTTVVEAVRVELASHYYRPVPEAVLRLQTVSSIIAALHDPYTEYVSRRAYEVLRRKLAHRYVGVGMTVLPSSAGLVVVAVSAGPARSAGVEVGDTIVRIDDRSAVGLGAIRAAALLAGPIGAPLRLEARRQGHVRRFVLTREEVFSPNVTSRTVTRGGKQYGYIYVLWFGKGTSARVASDLLRFRAEGVDGIVLDLRGDPGGLLSEGIHTASLFLHGGRVVTLAGAHQPSRTYRANAADLVPRLPVAVLVDRGSASAAEIVAAALRDNGRATVVGTRTFGKAVVQTLEPLADGGALAFTSARYLTPAGADISRHGVTPQVVARDDPRTSADEVLGAALSVLGRETVDS